jgi:hypothetical protein
MLDNFEESCAMRTIFSENQLDKTSIVTILFSALLVKRFFEFDNKLSTEYPVTGDQRPVKTRKSLLAFVGLSVGSVLGICSPLRAQISGGIVAGTITDSSGAVISSAKLKATNQATHVATETSSGSTGAYHFVDIPVGVYTVTVDAPGFETTSNSSVVVQLQTTTTLNLALRVGPTTQTVDVTTASAQVETQSSEIGTVVSPQMVEDLPLSVGSGSMRNAGDFVFLAPATYGVGTAGGDYEFSLSGGRLRGLNPSWMAPACRRWLWAMPTRAKNSPL